MLSKNFQFTSVLFTQNEIKKYEKEIIEKAKISQQEYVKLYEKLFQKIDMVDENEIKPRFIKKAIKIMKDIDENDSLFIALAMQEKCGVWSDDPHFKEQKKVKNLTTKDLVKELEKNEKEQ